MLGTDNTGMAQADPLSLQILADAADPVLAQQQERFNSLVRDVALWRAALSEWKDRIERHRQAIEPVRRELRAAWRQWVLALDDASLQPGLSRAERKQLGDLLREAVAPLSDVAAGDEELLENLDQDWERQAAAAEAQRAERAAKRRAASALKRRRSEEQEASSSVRDVYRRLARALHPDRETDGPQRERKTLLMQHANRAYAEQDLLGLLEVQLQAEQFDAAQLAGVDRRRLQHYIAVLQEQLAGLQLETRCLEAEFREATGLPPGTGLQARKADRMISSEAQRLRSTLILLQRQARSLRDADAVKAWLRQQRKDG